MKSVLVTFIRQFVNAHETIDAAGRLIGTLEKQKMNPACRQTHHRQLAISVWLTLWSMAAASTAASSKVVGISFAASQQSCVSSVITDLQKYFASEDGESDCRLVSLVTSRSVTKRQRRNVIQQILQSDEEQALDVNKLTGNCAVALSSGFVLIQPNPQQLPDLIRACCDLCDGNVLYYPDPVDIQRGEGLLDTLGPLLEELLQQSKDVDDVTPQSSLYVLVPSGIDASAVQSQLERSINELLPHLKSSNGSSDRIPVSLSDIFQNIRYVSPDSVVSAFFNDHSSAATTTRAVLDRNAQAPGGGDVKNAIQQLVTVPQNLAAARSLEPKARELVQQIVDAIQRASSNDVGATTADAGKSVRLVTNFGELCDAIIKQELKWDVAKEDAVASSALGLQIYNTLLEEVFINVSDLFVEQMTLLQKFCWDELKKNLSKVLISPNLQNDMQKLGQSSIAAFVSGSVKLMPKTSFKSSASSISFMSSYIASASNAYARRVQDYIANRILLARASGKFRPIPRKGVTVGFHWLLPKPFGNDYRQEPWMVHATDNMVYVPKDSKLMDVPPDQVMTGEWKNQIVPHPPGNDMLYMQ